MMDFKQSPRRRPTRNSTAAWNGRNVHQCTQGLPPLSSSTTLYLQRRSWLLAVLLGGILLVVVVVIITFSDRTTNTTSLVAVVERTAKTASKSEPKNDDNNNQGSAIIMMTTDNQQVKRYSLPARPEKPSSVQFFSRARHDRAGAALLDMLLCHAFAWQEQVTYGGACIEQETNNNSSNNAHFQQEQQLIHWMGLQDELPFACPSDRFGILMNRHDYFADDTSIFTKEWLDHVQSAAKPTSPLRHYHHPATMTQSTRMTTTTLQVAVHVRRGDVTPCTEPERYLPNSYYLALLDQYVPADKGANVTIYSDADLSSREEKWKDFTDRGYTLALKTTSTDLRQVWQAFITADIFIMSKSSFSLVPALFNHNTVVYTPFWHQPLAHWTAVPQKLVDAHTKNVAGVKC